MAFSPVPIRTGSGRDLARVEATLRTCFQPGGVAGCASGRRPRCTGAASWFRRSPTVAITSGIDRIQLPTRATTAT